MTVRRWASVAVAVAYLLLGNGCLGSEHPLLPFTSYTPTSLTDGWVVSTPAAEGVDAAGLQTLYEELHQDTRYWQLRSLLVIRNGRLIAESYLKDTEDQTRPRPVWSVTKQILALLAGQAVEAGVLGSLNDSIGVYLGNASAGHPDKQSIRLEDLLTMRSGIAFDERGDVSSILQRTPANTLEYLLSIPMFTEPGTAFHYNSGDSHLLAAALQAALGRPLLAWADEVLFSPIGMTNYEWLALDEIPYGGFGLSTTPRDLARVAQLVLDRGLWQGVSVVDSTWIDTMLLPRVGDIAGVADFGYHWWIRKDGGLPFMAGSGGQFAVIIPGQNLVVVAMSEHDTDNDLELTDAAMFSIVDRVLALVN